MAEPPLWWSADAVSLVAGVAGGTPVDRGVSPRGVLRDVRGEARADAVKRASDQAQGMAGAAGVELGAVRSISEVPQQTGYPFDQLRLAHGVGAGGVADAAPVPLAPGSQELTVTVTVVFDIG